ncbi:MAG: 4Fe-4S binding protein [Clostridiales Family XIII bacterium]|jgi:NADH-quinone oxidoreductase subunit F|nr:4Fe-4S binding protein [Clostridiales Family XIII bacterium]
MTSEITCGCEATFAALAYPDFDGERDCPVRWSHALMELVSTRTCGRDTLCREGSLQLCAVLADVSTGKGRDDDAELTRELLALMRENANCDMARLAAEKSLSLVDARRDEWDRHVAGKRCPALACPALVTVYVAPESCSGCGECRAVCPRGAIAGGDGMIHVIDRQVCDRCYRCVAICKDTAIQRSSGAVVRTPDAPVPVGGFGSAGAGSGRRRRRRV